MKRVLSILLALSMTAALCACGSSTDSAPASRAAIVAASEITASQPEQTNETDYSEPEPEPDPEPQPEPEPAPVVTRAADVDYVLNTNTMKFHIPSCSSVSQIKDENREDFTGARDQVIGMGYAPCGQCKP